MRSSQCVNSVSDQCSSSARCPACRPRHLNKQCAKCLYLSIRATFSRSVAKLPVQACYACRCLQSTSTFDAQAADVGNKAAVPLGIANSDLQIVAEVSRGTQSTIHEGRYRDQSVVVKKAKISKSADLDNFKLEVAVMASLRQVSSVVSLVAARLVPPGASLACHLPVQQSLAN